SLAYHGPACRQPDGEKRLTLRVPVDRPPRRPWSIRSAAGDPGATAADTTPRRKAPRREPRPPYLPPLARPDHRHRRPRRLRPDRTYSRLAWLPIIGPSSWLLWGTIATQLRAQPH